MQSDADRMFEEFGAPSITDYFGERDERGGFKEYEYRDGSPKPRILRGVILGRSRVEDEENSLGGDYEHRRKVARLTIHIPVSQEWGRFTPAIGRIIALDNGEQWSIDSWKSGALVQVMLSRTLTMEKGRAGRYDG